MACAIKIKILNGSHIHLSADILKDVALQMGIFTPENFEQPIQISDDDPLMYYLKVRIDREENQDNPFFKLYIEAAEYMLAVHFLTHHYKKSITRPLKRTRTNRRSNALSNTIAYIQKNLNSELSLKDLSAQANMSEFHFSRFFKDKTGFPPHQFIIHERMKKACSLLRTTHLPIDMIANQLGYSDSYFIQAFKRHMGTTPAKYRKQ